MTLARGLSLTGRVTATGAWSDPNHDRVVDASEISINNFGFSFSSNFDTATQLTFPPGSPIDPALRNSRTREAVVGVDQQLARDLSVSASYIHRIDDRYIATTTQATTPIKGNQPGHYATYQGVDVALHKRFGNRWMLNAAWTRQSSIDHWPAGSCAGLVTTSCVSGTIPSAVDALDGRPADLNLPRYLAKLNGRVALPWGIGLSATANVQDGFVRNIVSNVPNPIDFGQSTQLVALQGTTRYPAMTMIDGQIDRSIRLRGRARLTLSLVAFNLLNENTVYSQANNQSLSAFGNVLAIVGPRVLRFGVTATF
jgi:hypothetical protein